MSYAKPKAERPIAPKPLTEEEKTQRIMRFLQQKREEFSIRILQGLCTNMGENASNALAKAHVGLAVEMADNLLKALYPLEENPNNK